MDHKSLWRRVRISIVSFTVALLATMSAAAQMVNQTRPYSGTTVNPCNGETISFSGSIHFHEKTQVSNDGRIHFVANNNFNVSGTGATTGASYSIGGTMHTNSKFPTFPIAFRQRTRFVSLSSAAPSFYATFAFHVNCNGEQTQVTTSSDCN